MPIDFLPYMFFSPHASYFSSILPSGSLRRGNFSLYLSANLQCEAIESLLTPRTTASRALILRSALLKSLASVVQPGRVVAGIEIDDDVLPGEVLERDLASRSIRIEIETQGPFGLL